MSIWDLSKTADSNITFEGLALGLTTTQPSVVDNTLRAIAAVLAEFRDDLGGQLTSGGSANVQTLTTNGGLAALADGVMIGFVAGFTNTAAATMTVDGLAVKALRKVTANSGNDAALDANDIRLNGHYLVRYDVSANAAAGAWVLLNPAPTEAYSQGHLWGLTLSNNVTDPTNDIDIAVGSARDSTNAVNMVLAAALTKQLDVAWAVGSGLGGLDTGAIANTTYHIWLIKRSDTGVVDALFSTSATAPTMPASYDYKRRIGSIVRASAAIRGFTQTGDEFHHATASQDINTTTLGTTAVTYTLATIPIGISVEAFIRVSMVHASVNNVLVTSLSEADLLPNALAGQFTLYLPVAGQAVAVTLRIRTNTSAQIRGRSSAASTSLYGHSFGWVDTRGRAA